MKSRCVVLLVLGLASTLAAAPVFTARTSSGKQYTGPLLGIHDDWSVDLGKARRRIPGKELLSLAQQHLPLPAFPSDEHLILANGDRIPVRDLRLDDEKIFFRHKDLENREISLPLSAAVLIWRLAPDRTVFPEKMRQRLLGGSRARDVVLLRNSDVIEGTLSRIAAGDVQVEVNKKRVAIRWNQVSAIALSTELADKLRPNQRHARVVLLAADGSPGGRFTLSGAEANEEVLSGKTVFGATLRVPLERLVALDVLGEGATYLSELEPSRYEYFPYLDEKWSWGRDATVSGRDLLLAGSTYDRGLGMHAHARLSYALEGKYRRFESLVGLDDRDGKRGLVRINILVDGKAVEVEKLGKLSHKDGAVAISVNVEGGKELTLEVANGDSGPVQAVVNWANARLVR